MTLRQQILRWVYPLFRFYKKSEGKTKSLNRVNITSPVSIYDLSIQLNDGKELVLKSLMDKKIMIVNTASNCGYTNQYAELQKLYQHSKEDLVIIAFPSNDFKDQEKGTDEEIEKFCRINFGISFLLAKKTIVRKGPHQHKVFQWLTQKELNGWNEQEPSWNFAKYLVDEQGNLTHYFHPAVSPLSTEVIRAVHQ